jgi:flagellar biosynthesis/type III secretory pathway protein FliH
MSALIKSSSARLGSVRPFPFSGAAPAPAPGPSAVERLAAEIEAMKQALTARDEALAELAKEVEQARREGEEAGRAAGRKEADNLAAEKVQRVEAGLAEASARFDEDLRSTERLAALLAETCLEKLFGHAHDRGAIVCALISAQMRALEAEAVVRITVSAADFEPGQLDGVAAAAQRPGCEIVAAQALEPGACTMKLALGSLEVGIGQQWGSLRSALAEIAGAGADE